MNIVVIGFFTPTIYLAGNHTFFGSFIQLLEFNFLHFPIRIIRRRDLAIKAGVNYQTR